MKKIAKLLVMVMVMVLCAGVFTSCGKKETGATDISSVEEGYQTPLAQDVITKYNTDNKEVAKVPAQKYVSNEIAVDEASKIEFYENNADGKLNGANLTIKEVDKDREAKLDLFYAQMKKLMSSVDSRLTEERINELFDYLVQIEPKDATIQTTRNVENEGVKYSIYYSETEVTFIIN